MLRLVTAAAAPAWLQARSGRPLAPAAAPATARVEVIPARIGPERLPSLVRFRSAPPLRSGEQAQC